MILLKPLVNQLARSVRLYSKNPYEIGKIKKTVNSKELKDSLTKISKDFPPNDFKSQLHDTISSGNKSRRDSWQSESFWDSHNKVKVKNHTDDILYFLIAISLLFIILKSFFYNGFRMKMQRRKANAKNKKEYK